MSILILMTSDLRKSGRYIPVYKHKLLRGKELRKVRVTFQFEPSKAIRILLNHFPYGMNINSIAKNLSISRVFTKKLLERYGFKYKKIGTNKLYYNLGDESTK